VGISQPARFVRFGTFQLDVVAGELRRNGAKVRVPDQSVKVLAMLVQAAGEVVTRDELHQRLWPNGTIVEFDNSINLPFGDCARRWRMPPTRRDTSKQFRGADTDSLARLSRLGLMQTACPPGQMRRNW
jgi:hypothetical protein